MGNYNYQAYSPSLDKSCGHMHHSEKKAMACADHLGWADAIPRKIHKPTFKRDSIPNYVGIKWDDTDIYESVIRVKFFASDVNQIPDSHERILNVLRNNVKTVVQAEIVSTKKAKESE